MTDPLRWRDEREIRVEAEPARVWAAWAEPAHVARWFADEGHGSLEPGGEIVHVFHGHGEHRYRVLEVEPERRLVLEGEMDGIAFRQETVLTYRDGVTVLTLVHSGFGSADPDSEITQGIDSGWAMALAVFKHYVERWYGRDKVSLSLFRPATFDYTELVQERYAAGLHTWLTAEVSIGSSDPPRLRSGLALRGHELVRTDHEIARTWEELDGVLELKAFGSAPDARVLGVRVSSWSPNAEARLAALRPELEAAVERLARA